MPGADTSKGQMPRPRHSHLNCVWERLTAHKATCVNSVYGFTFIVTDVGLAVEDQVYEVTIFIQKR